MIILKVTSPLGQDKELERDVSRTRNEALLGYEKDGETSSALRVDPGRQNTWLSLGQHESETGRCSWFTQTSYGERSTSISSG